jgi:uncharacterized tellurite resistance protein B-like protein
MDTPIFNYNQAVFGLMLLGAKADGKLQDEEKRLLVELTSEEHHLSAEEYKFVILEAKNLEDDAFAQAVYDTLNAHSSFERVKALYWLGQVIESDRSSDNTTENNEQESRVYHKALHALDVTHEDVAQYAKSRL